MAEALNTLLSGKNRGQSGSFLVRMPAGILGRQGIAEAARSAYSTEQHPDLRILDPDKSTITVDDIRSLRDFFSARPMVSDVKTTIVVAAERMNLSAANALLKTLEEPASKSKIILVTDAPWKLLPTIVSRCLFIAEPYSEALARADMDEVKQGDHTEDQIKNALEISGNNPVAANEILKFNLTKWHSECLAWLVNPTVKHPAVPQSGKEYPSLKTIFTILQSTMLAAASNPTSLKGWTPEKVDAALKTLQSMSAGIERTGLDWKTRVFATLHLMAHAGD